MCIHQLHWQARSELQNKLSKVEQDWLFDEGSLTRRLTTLSKNNFSLEILSEKEQLLRDDEYAYLNIPSSYKEWVREVVLKGNNQPWIYARSVIVPSHDKQQDQQSLKNIGKQPLGAVLFDKGKFKRSFIEVSIYPQEILPSKYCYCDLWARRSKFQSDTQIVLVQEILLPQFRDVAGLL